MKTQILSLVFLSSLKIFALPPEPLQNFVPLVLVNQTGVADSEIYFLAHGLDACGLPCYLVPDSATGQCDYRAPDATGVPSSAALSKTLDTLPLADGYSNGRLVYLPINSSSRAYLSVYNPMYLPTAYNPAPTRKVLDILDSSVTTFQDVNYYTLYQNFEFGLVPLITDYSHPPPFFPTYGTQLFLNLSWVDYFTLPMRLDVCSYPSQTVLNGQYTPSSGFDASLSRETIISQMNMEFTAAASPVWTYLSTPFYKNPYAGTPSNLLTTLRVLAAKNSIDLGLGHSFAGASPLPTFFPEDYIHNTIYGPSGTNFMAAVHTYFTTQTFDCKIHPANPEPANAQNYTYQVSAAANSNLQFHYTGPSIGNGYPVPLMDLYLSLANLTTEQLLSGSVWPFTTDSANMIPAPATQTSFTNELSKMVSSLFTIGQFPLQLTYTSPFDVIDAGYAEIQPPSGPDSYFLTSAPPFSQGPWFNLYDKALHQQQINKRVPNNSSYGLGYGYDYDDLLNMAGLIQPTIQDQYGNPSAEKPYVLITLGSLAGTPRIDIKEDKYTASSGQPGYETIPFPIKIGPLSAGSETTVTFLWHDENLIPQTTPASATEVILLENLTADKDHPFQIKFAFSGDERIYTINALRQVVLPSSPTNSYSTIDQTYISGVVFSLQMDMMGQYLLISINSTNPPWPG